MHVSKKCVLPLSLCLNEPERPTLTAARRPSRLKLEQLTGADGPARSRALLGLEWKCHYHINHGCSRIDHSLCTEIMMAVCLSLRKTIILNAAPFITLWFALHGTINVFFFSEKETNSSALKGCCDEEHSASRSREHLFKRDSEYSWHVLHRASKTIINPEYEADEKSGVNRQCKWLNSSSGNHESLYKAVS